LRAQNGKNFIETTNLPGFKKRRRGGRRKEERIEKELVVALES